MQKQDVHLSKEQESHSFLNISCCTAPLTIASALLICTYSVPHRLAQGGNANIMYIFCSCARPPLPCLVLHQELLMSYCPLVERLGFDENFMDVTKMVDARLAETQVSNNLSFKGHVYNHFSKSHLFPWCVAVHLRHLAHGQQEMSCETSQDA